MTKAEVEQLEDQILSTLSDDRPQSVRHVFYRMTDPRLPVSVEKSEAGYRQVQNRTVEMRRSGMLPYGWLSDTTRRGYHTPTYASAAAFLRSVNSLYRADVWRGHHLHVEVWCESRSIAGVIQHDCEEYAVSLYPAGGFSSLTFIYEAAQNIEAHLAQAHRKAARILYIGDYDPAGVLIDKKIRDGLQGHLPDVELDFRRLAINPEQIAAYGLPTKPRKAGDRRAKEVANTVEAEAMPATVLRGLLRSELDTLLPASSLAAIRAAEESERKAINLAALALEDEE